MRRSGRCMLRAGCVRYWARAPAVCSGCLHEPCLCGIRLRGLLGLRGNAKGAGPLRRTAQQPRRYAGHTRVLLGLAVQCAVCAALSKCVNACLFCHLILYASLSVFLSGAEVF